VSSVLFLRKQAETIRHLSRTCFDLTIAGRLRELADEFVAKADELEHTIEVPAGVLNHPSGAKDEIEGE